jgi:hypothetical protein
MVSVANNVPFVSLFHFAATSLSHTPPPVLVYKYQPQTSLLLSLSTQPSILNFSHSLQYSN